MNGTFEDFLAALLAFESGWDRERYDSGDIQDWQLNQWSGGTVGDFYPNYSSWSELSDEEWSVMAFRSMNTYGFVGYQFGEALLIDLGYYDDDFYYGNGASANTWDGTWTGKNGANSLEDFMTEEVQQLAIQDAFGHNLSVIQDLLSANGESLEDYLGTTITYIQDGVQGSVELTLTGILAGAHLRGAPALVELLQNGTISNDEYGTSILQYIDQFGGFSAPSIDEIIANFEEGKTGDEGLGGPGEGNTSGGSGNGSADVTADEADVAIDWSWGQSEVIADFDSETDTIFIGWFTAEHIEIGETSGDVVFAIPSNNQSVTLSGVTLSDLDADNFTILDSSAAEKILSLIGSSEDDNGTDEEDNGDVTDENDNSDDGNEDDGGTVVDEGEDNDAGDGNGVDTHHFTWNWGAVEVISNFDASEDILDFGSLSSKQLSISEVNDDLLIEVLNNGGHTYVLENIQAEDLTADNFAAPNWNYGVLEDEDGVFNQLIGLGASDFS